MLEPAVGFINPVHVLVDTYVSVVSTLTQVSWRYYEPVYKVVILGTPLFWAAGATATRSEL